MASSENQQQPPYPAPPSLSAGGHETRDDYAAQVASRPSSQDEPYLTPYLGLRARLSQTWINRWTILLLLVLIRTLFALATLDDNIGIARKQALSACHSVEDVGSAMASMPHYMSQGVNELTAMGFEKAINGLMEMLILTVTGVEEIVLFYIHMLTTTYLCLITLAVSGSLHVAVTVAQDVGDFLNSTIQDVGKDLSSASNDFQQAMNGFIKDIDKLGSVLTDNKIGDPPSVNFSSEISTLNGIQLPPDYDQNLNTLNASIPTFEDVKNFTDDVIKAPFELVKQLLNDSMPKYSMNSSLFPVPAKKQLTFCSDNNKLNKFFDELIEIKLTAKRTFLIAIIIAAVAVMVPMAYREYRRYMFMKNRSQMLTSGVRDPMGAVYLVSRPYTSEVGIWLSKPFSSSRTKALVRWAVAYATTVPALLVLSLALAGLFSCLCQFILLKALEKEVPALENQVIGFADDVINALSDASQEWSNGTNRLIADTNHVINGDIFGWVNTTTSAVNDTLNAFVDEMYGVLNKTFGNTVLYEPITGVLNCLVVLKIQGIEKGLTWVSDHAHVDFQPLQNNTFSLGTVAKITNGSPDVLSTGPNGTAANAITGAVNHVTNVIEKTIRHEALISCGVLMIWIIIALIGIIRATLLFFKGGHDEAVYLGPGPLPHEPTSGEKYEMDDFPHHGVPSYEQATKEVAPGDHSGDLYNGHKYTLTPNPIPTFAINTATSPILNTGFNPRDEKVGMVNGQNVDAAIRRPTHIRASSHGDYADTSPIAPRANPFLSPNESNFPPNNPFADPRR